MANRKQREKLPPEQKSRVYSIRLDPKNMDDLWVIDAIEFYAEQKIELKALFKELLAQAEGKPVEQMTISARDVSDMIATIRELKEMLENGVMLTGGKPTRSKSRRAKVEEIEYSDTMRSTFDKFVSRGFSADDLADGDDE